MWVAYLGIDTRVPATVASVTDAHSLDDAASVYAGSDGRYYADADRDCRLADGTWRRCVLDRARGYELVATRDGSLLSLERTTLDAIPAWIEPRTDRSGRLRLVDTRRPLPPGVSPAADGARLRPDCDIVER